MAADGKTPPQPTHRGGAGTLCVHVVSLCADTINNDMSTLRAHVHTYIQTNHKSIQTKSSHT